MACTRFPSSASGPAGTLGVDHGDRRRGHGHLKVLALREPTPHTRVVILDRDGVIDDLVKRPPDLRGESPLSVDEVRLTEGVTGALHRIRTSGYLLACVTDRRPRRRANAP